MHHVVITPSPRRDSYTNKNNTRAVFHPPCLLSIPAQCRENLTELSLVCRQFIFDPLLWSKHLSTHTDQTHENLPCPRGACFSRIHSEPRLSSLTGRGAATLEGMRECAFQARELGGISVQRVARIALLYRLRTCCLRIKCLRDGPTRNLGDFAVELVTIIVRVTTLERSRTPHLTLTTSPSQLILPPQWWPLISNPAPPQSNL
jgi:hypothetical protein